jgi:signal transduction histidine kinase
MTATPTLDQLLRENEDLRRRLEEAEDAIRALQAGEADAVLVEAGREQVFTLEAADKSYRLLVAQIPYPAAALTADGIIIACNHHFADLLGRPLASLLKQSIHAFVTSEGRSVLEKLLSDGLDGDTHGEIPLQPVDAPPVSAYLGVSALREGALGLCLMVTDLTEWRHYQLLQRTQEALRASEERLREAGRNKDEFLATLAHELRNPLAAMRSAVQLLEAEGGPPPPQLEWARGVLDRQVRLMARLLEDLLDVSRISRNRLELRTEAIELARVLEAALETSRPAIEAGGHRLTVTVPPEPIHVMADPIRLAQVFANLLNNAARYTEDGGRIDLTAGRDGNEVIVSVSDSGIGIAADVLPRIFDIFAQAKPDLVSSQGGLGIGLSLVKGVVDLHGGTVEARSAGPGQGSEFTVRLPMAAATLLPQPPPARDSAQQRPTMRYRVLVVDDNPDGADTLAMLLQVMGHDVDTAYDGEHAIETAERMRPDVILLDIGMPKLDGYETCRRIRERPWAKAVFVVALTGWGQEEDRRRTEAVGFDRHMIKPVDPAALTSLLDSLAPRPSGPNTAR